MTILRPPITEKKQALAPTPGGSPNSPYGGRMARLPGTLRATSAREENFLLVLRFVWLGSELRALPHQFTPKHRAQRMLETIGAPGPRGGGESRLSCSTPPPRHKTHTKLPPVNDDLPRNLLKNDIRRFSRCQDTRNHVLADDKIGSSHFPLPYLSPELPLVPRNSTGRGSVQKGKDVAPTVTSLESR